MKNFDPTAEMVGMAKTVLTANAAIEAAVKRVFENIMGEEEYVTKY